MRIDHSARQPLAKARQLAALSVAICTMTISAPTSARASGADCTAAKAAATLQSKTPFHATFTVTPTTPGVFPTEHHEEIWVNNRMYTLLSDKRWLSAPVPSNPMGGFTGPISGFSDCRPVPSASIRGDTAAGYDIEWNQGGGPSSGYRQRAGSPFVISSIRTSCWWPWTSTTQTCKRPQRSELRWLLRRQRRSRRRGRCAHRRHRPGRSSSCATT